MTFRTYLVSALLIGVAVLPSLYASPESSSPDTTMEEPYDYQTLISLKPDSPLLIKADKIDYIQETDTLIATGNVQLAQGKRILHAKKIIYNKRTGKITAEGDIYLKEPNVGNFAPNAQTSSSEFLSHQDYVLHKLMENSVLVANPLNLPALGKQLIPSQPESEETSSSLNYDLTFSPYAEFGDKFQNGLIDDIKILTADEARLAANSAKRIGGNKVIFYQAVYSPCNVCKADLSKPPLWQLKADKIIHSKEDQTITYHHARLEVGGIPALYMPIFRHADPTVKRKSGFLMPTYGAISDLGIIVSTPYYHVIAPNRDLTLVPIVTTKQGPIMMAEYRHRLRDGNITGSVSYTQTRDLKRIHKGSSFPNRNRWHIFTQGRLDLNDEHVATFDINRASDTTYLRRYPILPQGFRLKYPVKNMVSTAAVEQFKDHNYGVIRATGFQTDNPDKTPYIVPHAWYNYQSDPSLWNGIWSFDASFLSLGRRLDTPEQNARHMQRFSFNGGWRLPYVSPTGHIWTLKTTLRTDAYALEHFQPTRSRPSNPSSFKGRVFPSISGQWRYPLRKSLKSSEWILEPTTMITATPRVNNGSIPNEDSLNIQVEDTSLFLPQRFSGLDRVDTGGRFIYGATSTWYFTKQRLIQLFLGHNFRLDNHRVLPIGAGEDKRASDIVSRLRVNPTNSIQLLNRMAIHYKRTRPRISDTSAIFGKKLLVLQLNHTFVNKDSTANGVGISQATWVIGSNPIDHWSFSLGETRNLKRHQRGALSHTISALYHDECFRMTMSAFKTRSSDRDIRPNSGFVVQFDFKNLGSVNLLDTIGLNTNNVL